MNSDLTGDSVPVEDEPDTPEVKLKRVIFEYEDGTIEYLEGEAAQIWMDSLNREIVMSFVHGGRMPELKWKPISKEHAASLFL